MAEAARRLLAALDGEFWTALDELQAVVREVDEQLAASRVENEPEGRRVLIEYLDVPDLGPYA